MVSKPNTGRSANEEASPEWGGHEVECANKDVGPRRMMDCEISRRLKRETKDSL